MLVKHIVKNETGTYELTGEMGEDEYNFIFSAGMNLLLQEGAMVLNGEYDSTSGAEYDTYEDEIEGTYVGPKDLN